MAKRGALANIQRNKGVKEAGRQEIDEGAFWARKKSCLAEIQIQDLGGKIELQDNHVHKCRLLKNQSGKTQALQLC